MPTEFETSLDNFMKVAVKAVIAGGYSGVKRGIEKERNSGMIKNLIKFIILSKIIPEKYKTAVFQLQASNFGMPSTRRAFNLIMNPNFPGYVPRRRIKYKNHFISF